MVKKKRKMSNSSIRLKLLIDTRAKRVLFAEADKDCVDFLFYILSLPVAKLIDLVGKQGMVGSLANLYESIENLNDSYVQPNQAKDTLLKPSYTASSAVPLLALEDSSSGAGRKTFYKCSCNNFYFSDSQDATCPTCRQKMTRELQYVGPPVVQSVSSGAEGGFVKGVVTYMVMDDLAVSPMSTISSITLLNKFNIKEVGALKEKVVNFGMTEFCGGEVVEGFFGDQECAYPCFLQPNSMSVVEASLYLINIFC
ncbi:hypothetical protein STAS_21468 [Striga asiatica]|uniref:Uncharacterized protein n=1 Tax=Striga asiatica TaxID=4170 RepID=A0A5A7QGU9_STRAF|nr:hypothetical protein STAS_21468 [Striga asiatica]